MGVCGPFLPTSGTPLGWASWGENHTPTYERCQVALKGDTGGVDKPHPVAVAPQRGVLT